MQGKHEYQPRLFSMVQIEALIPKNHLLRKLDESLDLSFLRELTEPLYCKGNGRPSIDSEIFVRMLLIEYLYDVPSDRQLCEEIGYNLAYRWFCRLSLEDEIPDHSSMTRIRDRLGEATFQKIFIHIVKLCEKSGLVKGKRVMTDGSLIKANAAMKSLEQRKPQDTAAPQAKEEKAESSEEILTTPQPSPVTQPQVESIDVKSSENTSETQSKKKRKSKSIFGKSFSNKTHVSSTDPDATLAGKKDETKLLRYNVHQSIDPDHRIIIDCHVTTGAVPDGTVYQERLLAIENNFDYKIEEATADRGYGYGENLQFLKDKGIKSFVPRMHKDVGEKTDREKTPYDVAKDEFRCELGNALFPYPIQSDGNLAYRPKKGSCDGCDRKPWCVIKRHGLKVNAYHQVQYETRLMEQTDEYKVKRRERMWKVEGLFAEGKTFHGLSRARYRRKWKVQVQIYLTASVQNLKKLVGIALGDFISILADWIQFEIWKNRVQKISFSRAAFA